MSVPEPDPGRGYVSAPRRSKSGVATRLHGRADADVDTDAAAETEGSLDDRRRRRG